MNTTSAWLSQEKVMHVFCNVLIIATKDSLCVKGFRSVLPKLTHLLCNITILKSVRYFTSYFHLILFLLYYLYGKAY